MNEIIDIDSESKSIKSEANNVEEARESHRCNGFTSSPKFVGKRLDLTKFYA